MAIRLMRLRLGLTRESFARRLGVSPLIALNWETGRLAPGTAAHSLLMAEAEKAELDLAALEALMAVIAMINRSDRETAEHAERVSVYAELVAQALGEFPFDLAVAGYLHDVGKIMLPPAILQHPGGLSLDERLIVQAHVTASSNLALLLAGEKVARYVAEHHERLDGSGYPLALGEAEISHGGRILAVCDEFTGRTSRRGYHRGPQTPDRVLDEMEKGGRFDHAVVKALRQSIGGDLSTYFKRVA